MPVVNEYRRHMIRRELSAETIKMRARCLRSFEEWLDGQPIETATTEQVETFLDQRRWRGKPMGAKTRYGWLSHLGCFYEWATDYGRADQNPTRRIIRPKVRQGLPRPIRDADLARAITNAGADLAGWLTLMAYAGLRCGEVAGMQRDWILDGSLHVVGKGRRERVVPMHPKVEAVFDGRHLPRSGPVWRRQSGSPWTPAHVSRRVNGYLSDLGIDATAHQCRHFFGSKLYQQTHDLRLVQQLLGHSSPTTTAIYTALADGAAAEAVALLPDVAA